MVSKPQSVYAGFDPTADSLHVGNLLVIMGLIHFQRAGHKPIALIGGATGRIGDPSGKTKERTTIQDDVIEHNLSCIRKQIERVFENHEKHLWTPKSKKAKLHPIRLVRSG